MLFAMTSIAAEPTDGVLVELEPPDALSAPTRARLQRLFYYYKLLASDEDGEALEGVMHELANVTSAPNYHNAIMNLISRTVMANHARDEDARQTLLRPIERVAWGI